jgi:hypothetical protein
MSGVAAKLRVVHGGELKVVVHRGRHVEIDGPRAVAALGCWRRGHRHVRVLVAAQRLPGAEHAEAVGALVDDVSAASLGRRRRWQGRHAPALAFLHPGAVAAERLVRTEHLPARAALEPAARARGRRRAVVTVLAEQADVVVVLLGLRARFWGPALLVVLRSGPRPRVPRQHHGGHGHASSGVASDTLLAGSGSGVVRRRARFDRRRLTANRALLRRGDDSVSLWPSCTIEESLPAAPPLKNSGATTLMNCLELWRITGSCCVGLPSSTSVDEVDAREIAGEYAAAAAAAMTWERI